MSGYDVAVENARVVDGTGAPWFRGAVAVEDGRIAAVTRAAEGFESDAETVVDAGGDVVCPGFVDTHSHSDLEVFADPALEPKLQQGITTEVLGQDGFSLAPIDPDESPEWRAHLRGLAGDVDVDWTWGGVGEYLDAIEEQGVGPNVATLVGHGTVRFGEMGMDDRAPADADLAAMADRVTESLEAGAVGFSTGLIYAPQVNAETAEVRALAERLEPFGRPFVAHIRSEGQWLWDALDEFVDVGAEAGVPVHLSHYKVAGSQQHGKAGRANALIEAARERGVDFTAEQYPYTAGNTVLASVLPPWVRSMEREATLAALADPDARERIRRDIEENRIEGWENPALHRGWENVVVRNVDAPDYEGYEGMDLAAVAAARDQHPVEAVCDLLVAEEMDVNVIAHAMTEADVREIMGNERVCVATDGLFGAAPHPRTYGTYPRVLGRYVREANLLSLEEAVRKMTSLPARAMGFDRKGVLRPEMDADLVVFDPTAVGSPATYDDPVRHPHGVSHVVVDGTVAVADGEVTGELPGEALRA
jgi:N-acyl-D-amino-acid deacylase